jgi:hypothetical protein
VDLLEAPGHAERLELARVALHRAPTGGHLGPSPDPVGLPTLLRAALLVTRAAHRPQIVGSVPIPIIDVIHFGGCADTQTGSLQPTHPAIPLQHMPTDLMPRLRQRLATRTTGPRGLTRRQPEPPRTRGPGRDATPRSRRAPAGPADHP